MDIIQGCWKSICYEVVKDQLALMDTIQSCWKSICFDWKITCGVCFSFAPSCPRIATPTLPCYYFAVALVVVVPTSKKYLSFLSSHDSDIWDQDFTVERNFAKVNAYCAYRARWWRPGRSETSRRCGVYWVLYALITSSSVGCSGFAHWPLPLLLL